MARLNESQRATMANWWVLAEAGAYQGFLSTDVISAASDLARQAGGSLSFGEARDISTLYGYGRRMANAASALGAAPDDAVIDFTMIGVPPWARDEQVMNTTPIWHVTYEFSYLDSAGNAHTDLKTSIFEMTMPDTISGVRDAVNEDAQSLADKYGVELMGVNLTEILAVLSVMAISHTYRIAYLVKQYVERMLGEERQWAHFSGYVYERNSTLIKIAVTEPHSDYETCYEVRVRKLGRWKRPENETRRARSLPAA